MLWSDRRTTWRLTSSTGCCLTPPIEPRPWSSPTPSCGSFWVLLLILSVLLMLLFIHNNFFWSLTWRLLRNFYFEIMFQSQQEIMIRNKICLWFVKREIITKKLLYYCLNSHFFIVFLTISTWNKIWQYISH